MTVYKFPLIGAPAIEALKAGVDKRFGTDTVIEVIDPKTFTIDSPDKLEWMIGVYEPSTR